MFEHDISGCLRATIGGNGVEADILRRYSALLAPAVKKYAALRGTGQLALLDQPTRTDDLEEILQLAERIRRECATLVVLGTGGSSLGGQMLVELTQSAFINAATQVVFVDNVDPVTLSNLFTALNLEKTFFLVVSKSGMTAETVAQMLAACDRLGPACAKQMLVITEPGDNPLRQIAARHQVPVMDHPATLGGRFSVLSAVGLLPAAVAGVDIKKIRAGAASVLQAVFDDGGEAPIDGAALHAAFIQLGKYVNVVMSYSDRLRLFGLWYKQLWAESLGKQGKGSTAVRAVGAVDQHSQLQLYLDGPRDKLITLVLLDNKDKGPRLPACEGALSYLSERTMGDLLDAEQHATAETLTNNGCPVRIIRLKTLDEYTLGALIMHFMLETIFAAELIGVNAFDQPAVEESKRLAREYLSRSA